MYKTEKLTTGRYDVVSIGNYPVRIGHIVGAKTTWQADQGPHDLGYFTSKKSALNAIVTKHNKHN